MDDLTFDNDLPKITMVETFENLKEDVDYKDVGNGNIGPEPTPGATPTPTGETPESLKNYKIINDKVEPKEVKFAVDGEEVTLEEGDKYIFNEIKEDGKVTKKEEDGKVTITRTTESVSENAITKAVNKALKEIDKDSRCITIRVTEGEYNGDVNIKADMLDRVAEEDRDAFLSNFTLYILNESSYEPLSEADVAAGKKLIDKSKINSESSVSAKLNGNINIEGINVVLAGIYLSLEKKVNIKDANVTIYGSGDDDEIHIDRKCDSTNSEKTSYKKYILRIETGEGDDKVIYEEAFHIDDLIIETGDGNDEVKVGLSSDFKAPENRSLLPNSTEGLNTRINTGDGDDTVNVDIGIAQILDEGRILQIINEVEVEDEVTGVISTKKGLGYDSLILSGTLNKSGTDNNVVKSGVSGITYYDIIAKEEKGYKLKINTESDNLSDKLDGKPSVEVKMADISTAGTYLANRSFTNYVLKEDLFNAQNELTSITFIEDASKKPYFTKVIGKKNSFTIKYLDTNNIDVELYGKQITVDGSLKGKNILIKAEDTDKIDGLDEFNEALGQASEWTGIDANVELNVFDVKTDAIVHIKSGSFVTANGSAEIYALSTQGGVFKISVGQYGVQSPVAVKLGNATILIEGTVSATGKVIASSETKVDIPLDEPGLNAYFLPLTVVVAIATSETTLAEGATINSGSSTSLKSNTEVKSKAYSTAGILPISLALSVIKLNSHVYVQGNIISGADIEILANGKSDIDTQSKEKAPQTTSTTGNFKDPTASSGTTTTENKPPLSGVTGGNIFGGFFAIAVVLQNVDASATGNSHLIVDISEDLTLKVPNAHSMYLDAVDGEYMSNSEYQQNEIEGIISKDAEGNEITGDIEKIIGELKTLDIDLGLKTNEEIAEFIMTGELTNTTAGMDELKGEIKNRIEMPIRRRLLLGNNNAQTVKVKGTKVAEWLELELQPGEEFDFDSLTDELAVLLAHMLDYTETAADGTVLTVFTDAEIAELIFKSLTDEKKEELIERVLQSNTLPEADPTLDPEHDKDYRDLNIEIASNGDEYVVNNNGVIGTAEAHTNKDSINVNAVINNNGNIKVNQANGTFTANKVVTKYENADITAEAIAGTGNGDNIRMGNLKLNATGTDITDLNIDERVLEDRVISFIKGGEVTEMPTEEGKSWNIKRNPVTGKFEITFVTGVAQIRYDNADVETRVDAHAARDIEITETQGQTGLGQFVSDNGNIEITVPEDLIDVTENKNDVNISAMGNGQNAGNVTIHAANGGVGDNENRILVNAEGTVDVENKDDLYADSDVDLTIRVTTDGADMYVTSDQGIDLTNVSGDAHIEELLSHGDTKVTSENDIIVKNLSTNSTGTLSMNAIDGNINVAKTTGHITADEIKASGNVKMNLDSGLGDTHGDKVKEYEDAVIREAEAAAKVEGLQNKIAADTHQEQNLTDAIAYTNNKIANAEVTDQQADDAKAVLADENATEEEKAEALETVEKMQAQIDEIVDELTEALGHKINALENVEHIADIPRILQTEKDRVIAERQGYEALLPTAQAELTAAQADLTTKTAALNNETPAILAGGNVDLTLKEGASIGDSTNSVSIETGNGGKISLKAENGGRLNNVFI